MWLPKKLYESLPVFYVILGALFLAGSLYVGIDHWVMAGYAVVGVACAALGALIATVRHRARAKAEQPATRSEQLFV